MLATTTELWKMFLELHESVINLPKGNSSEMEDEINFRNKLCILSGAFCGSKGLEILAGLR